MSRCLSFFFESAYHVQMDYKYEDISLLDFVKTLSAYKGVSLRKLLAKLGEDDGWSNCYPSFYNKLKNDTIKFKEINDIAKSLGYEIIFKDVRK